MTTIQRDLTPFEVDRLERLRVHFSGRDGLDELIAEAEQEFRTAPLPPPCPSWCGQGAGHSYDSLSSDDESVHIRVHEHGIGDLVSVCQEERHHVTGGVELLPPFVTTYTDNMEMDADRAAEHGAAVLEAAAQLREIVGAA